MTFTAFIRYSKGSSVRCRVYDPASRRWWTGAAWSASEGDADITALAETALADAADNRFGGQMDVPEGRYVVEYLDGSDVIGEDVLGLTDNVEGSLDLRQTLRVLVAAVLGVTSGAGTSSVRFMDLSGGKARVTGVMDNKGNRLAVTLDGS